jgi:hypothetical protein
VGCNGFVSTCLGSLAGCKRRCLSFAMKNDFLNPNYSVQIPENYAKSNAVCAHLMQKIKVEQK